MNPATKAKTIGMILLAVLLVAVPAGMVYAGMGGDNPPNAECEAYRQEPPGPPCRTYRHAYITQHLGEGWDALGKRVDDPQPIPEWAFPDSAPPCAPGYCPCCWLAEGEIVEPQQWPERMAPPGPPPPESRPALPTEGHDGAEGKAQVPDGDVEVLGAISSGVQPPYRSSLNAHGRAWTRAGYEPGVITEVIVNVWLDWWDGATWIEVGSGFDSETQRCWRGLITARGLARDINAATGWYRVESLHRVYVDGVRIYNRWRLSDNVWLTFP